ncbi:MAG: AAA+ family ATPase, partial [Solirubrobacteraceae bacterium]
PRTHRNMLVFLAADVARIEELRDATRRWLAWTSIDRERESLNLDTVQRAQTGARCAEWNQAVDQRVGEAYSWLLVPAADPDSATVRWETSRASGSEPLAVRASRRLRSEEALIAGYSGARLRMDLDRVPLWRGADVALHDLWSFYTQYLYLPRLRDARVLLEAVADGVALMTWRQDGFAYADAFDEEASRYVGLRAGEGVLLSDPVGRVVQASVADAQLEAERREATATGAQAADGATTSDGDDTDPGDGSGTAVLRRFHGSVELDPTRMTRDASEVAEAVVAHLNGLLGASVRVTVEIDAELPDGVSDDVVRTVTENAGVLKFDAGSGFETS